ncbi:MAG: outer membrane protein assembly factor BamB family protein [Planctomycetota bacterium]|jgi:outer membrane protein assembly factor BamB
MKTLQVVLFLTLSCAGALARGGEPGELAARMVEDSKWKRGICVDVGADARLCVELARASGLEIYRVEKDAASAARTRKLVEAAGLTPLRVRVEVGPLEKLAYPEHCANLIVAPSAVKEVLRLLRPAGGVAYLSAAASAGKGFKAGKGPGGLHRLERLRLEGAGNWTHNGYDATNNRYSPDKYVNPPFRIKWYGNPRRSYLWWWGVRGLAADGRFFMADTSREDPYGAYIVAKDAYNGTVLWERAVGGRRFAWLPPVKGEGPAWMGVMNQPGKVHTAQIIVIGGRLYLADGPRLTVIDAATGKDLEPVIAPPPTSPKNYWNYVAHADGRLFGHTSRGYTAPYTETRYWPRKVTRLKEGGPATLFALDPESRKKLWVRGGEGEKELDPDFANPMAIGAGCVFLRSGNDLYALEVATGKTRWAVRGLDGEKETFWTGTVVGEKLHVYRYDKRFYCRRAVLPWPVFSTTDGKKLGEERPSRKGGQFFSSTEGVSRAPSGGNGCPLPSGAGKVAFGRNGYVVEGGGSRNYGSYRAGCRVPALPANGVIHFLPAAGCGCRIFSATITLDPGKTDEKLEGAPAPPLEKGTASNGSGAPAGADDWPTWRGNPARTAVTDRDLSGAMKKVWETEIGGELTAPIAAGDLVFCASMDETVHALDAKSGKPRWTFYSTGSISAPPAYARGRVYFGSYDGWVYCLSASDGKLVWRFRAAPFARRQPAFGRLVSAWPARQGLAVADGTVYCTAGRVPDQGVVTYALDAASGKMIWRTLAPRGVIPGGVIAVNKDWVFVPAAVSGPFVQLSRKGGKRVPKARGGSHFEYLSFVEGTAEDGPGFKEGFIVHGSSWVGRGHPKLDPYVGFMHNVFAAPYAQLLGAKAKGAHATAFGNGGMLMPLFGRKRVFFLKGKNLVAVERSKLSALRAVKRSTGRRRGNGASPRDKFLTWKAGELPCGLPEWAALAGDTILTGGAKGVTAVSCADGKPRWSVALDEATLDPAISRGRVFLTSKTGRVYCLAR